MAVAVIGFDSQLLLGGGNDLVGQLAFQSHGVLLLGGIVLGKILLTTFCYGSGAQGRHILAHARNWCRNRCLFVKALSSLGSFLLILYRNSLSVLWVVC